MSEQHKIVLHGSGVDRDQISGHLFRDLLNVLVEGAEQALRLRIQGRSTARGTPPTWLRSAADFSLLRPPELDASIALIEARPLFETMPHRFQQGDLFADLDPNQSPIELFEDALEDALEGNEDSDRFDPGLIRTFEKFNSLFEAGVEHLEIINGRVIHVDEPAVARIRQTFAKTFAPQRVRVTGRLETISYGDCRFTLVLDNGAQLQGTAFELGQGVLQGLFGQQVLVTGHALFRTSGQPLRIDADRIETASERDAKLWSAAPKPLLAPHSARQIREDQRNSNDLGALLGKWPGDESDDQIREALESLS